MWILIDIFLAESRQQYDQQQKIINNYVYKTQRTKKGVKHILALFTVQRKGYTLIEWVCLSFPLHLNLSFQPAAPLHPPKKHPAILCPQTLSSLSSFLSSPLFISFFLSFFCPLLTALPFPLSISFTHPLFPFIFFMIFPLSCYPAFCLYFDLFHFNSLLSKALPVSF